MLGADLGDFGLDIRPRRCAAVASADVANERRRLLGGECAAEAWYRTARFAVDRTQPISDHADDVRWHDVGDRCAVLELHAAQRAIVAARTGAFVQYGRL